jgi:hypothetical protein
MKTHGARQNLIWGHAQQCIHADNWAPKGQRLPHEQHSPEGTDDTSPVKHDLDEQSGIES